MPTATPFKKFRDSLATQYLSGAEIAGSRLQRRATVSLAMFA
jgi:hypothetical protein